MGSDLGVHIERAYFADDELHVLGAEIQHENALATVALASIHCGRSLLERGSLKR